MKPHLHHHLPAARSAARTGRTRGAVAASMLAVVALTGCGESSSPSHVARATVPAASPARLHGQSQAAADAVRRLERALRARDVAALCRPGAIFTRAVVRSMNEYGSVCESTLEMTPAIVRPPTLVVTRMTRKRDLARAEVRVNGGTPGGTSVPIYLVRERSRWLVSFSVGDNPIVSLEQ